LWVVALTLLILRKSNAELRLPLLLVERRKHAYILNFIVSSYPTTLCGSVTWKCKPLKSRSAS
jgi:hypothetical protein